jgi:hypothetical protein
MTNYDFWSLDHIESPVKFNKMDVLHTKLPTIINTMCRPGNGRDSELIMEFEPYKYVCNVAIFCKKYQNFKF